MTTTNETKPPYNTVSEPYSSIHYNAIKASLREATQNFDARSAAPFIYTVVKDCFLKHHVEDIFSACLIHRHYDISSHERNVESGGKAIASSNLADAYPSSWMFVDGKLYPYEYKRGVTPCPSTDFVREYGELLAEAGFEDLIGFQVYEPGIVGWESTDREGKVSTTVDHADTEVPPEWMKPASWSFYREEANDMDSST